MFEECASGLRHHCNNNNKKNNVSENLDATEPKLLTYICICAYLQTNRSDC